MAKSYIKNATTVIMRLHFTTFSATKLFELVAHQAITSVHAPATLMTPPDASGRLLVYPVSGGYAIIIISSKMYDEFFHF